MTNDRALVASRCLTGPGGAIDFGHDGPVVGSTTTCGAGEYCCNPACNQCVPVVITGCGPCLADAAA